MQSKTSAAQRTSSFPAGPSRNSERVAQAVRREDDRPQASRERRSRLGGPKMKLNVFGSIPGYHLYWCNDEDAAIEQLLAEGFEFVQPAEVKMESALVVDKDLDNRLSKYVGTRADGSPLRAYLLKATEELWQDFQDGNQAQADDWDEAIRQGEIEADRNRYKPTGYDIKLTTGRR